MSEYVVTVRWGRAGQPFVDNKYRRAHVWAFDGGVEVPASSSPSVVPLPYSESRAVDPEEAFVASLASCHMLWFLSIAAARKFCVDSYVDDARGVMGRNAAGKLAMTQVTLRPKVAFVGNRLPTKRGDRSDASRSARRVLHRELRDDRGPVRARRSDERLNADARRPGRAG